MAAVLFERPGCNGLCPALPVAARKVPLDVQYDGCTHSVGAPNLARQTSICLYCAQLLFRKLAHIDQLTVPVRHPADWIVSLLHFNFGSDLIFGYRSPTRAGGAADVMRRKLSA